MPRIFTISSNTICQDNYDLIDKEVVLGNIRTFVRHDFIK